MNDRHRQGGLPDRNIEYLLYQTLVGAWPLPADRAVAYMEKAAKEAKVHTSWTDPVGEYDHALRRFVERALSDSTFVADLAAFVGTLVDAGRVNSLSQTAIALTAPGVPDLYQGCELWDLSLVDPDNRRAVDFALRRRMLAELEDAGGTEVWARADEGAPKLWLISQVLDVRRRRPDAFGGGASYEPLALSGAQSRHAVAFVRGGEVLVLAPRLVLGLRRAGGWGETVITLPDGDWIDELSGEPVDSEGALDPARLFQSFPVAVLGRA
jgi:(1->4)-alpha-D-glucan 1-alpha-D-glucosylmutase